MNREHNRMKQQDRNDLWTVSSSLLGVQNNLDMTQWSSSYGFYDALTPIGLWSAFIWRFCIISLLNCSIILKYEYIGSWILHFFALALSLSLSVCVSVWPFEIDFTSGKCSNAHGEMVNSLCMSNFRWEQKITNRFAYEWWRRVQFRLN